MILTNEAIEKWLNDLYAGLKDEDEKQLCREVILYVKNKNAYYNRLAQSEASLRTAETENRSMRGQLARIDKILDLVKGEDY